MARIMTDDHKSKIGLANAPLMILLWQDPEYRERMSQAHKKHPTRYWLGKRRSEETKDKIRKFQKGKHYSTKTEFKKGQISPKKGKKYPNFSGENHPNWNNGSSFEPYSVDWTETLKKAIRERDNYICQLSGQYGNVVHHIDYDKKNCDPKNLITLSGSSHSKVNKNRDYWKSYFQNLINLKYND